MNDMLIAGGGLIVGFVMGLWTEREVLKSHFREYIGKDYQTIVSHLRDVLNI